jgi:hypothetical protein
MTRLSFTAGLLFVMFIAGGPASSQDMVEGDPAARTAIVEVIEAQVAAFQRDDGNAAFNLASPGIRAYFGSSTRFMQMVQSSYQSVYRPRSVEYRRLLIVRGEPIQEVFFVGLDLKTLLVLYRMEQQDDGAWRINGVLVADTKEQAT